jgi:hypothetical protein
LLFLHVLSLKERSIYKDGIKNSTYQATSALRSYQMVG